MKIGDFIAAMYEKPYFGIVTKLNSNSITAQFYIRSKAHSVFIEKKGDLDTITEERQGYIFSHVTTRGVVRDTTLSGKQKCFILPEFIHEDFDLSTFCRLDLIFLFVFRPSPLEEKSCPSSWIRNRL